MWYVYVLYSVAGVKTYVGYTNDVERRLFEHNVSESRGFTLRYRPWQVIHSESYISKTEGIGREKFFKTARGREDLKVYVKQFLDNGGAVSAAAEKD